MAALVRALPFVLLSLYVVAALFRVEWFENHETTSYLARVVETSVCWADGDLRARWFPDLAAGFGLPYLSFYAPLTFWGGAFFHQFGASVPTALKMVLGVAALLAMTGAYRLAREGAARGPALAAALLYVYSPYTVRNIYVRGDLAEYLAMAFLPWALYGLVRTARRPDALSALIAGAGGAGAILSHNILGLLTGLAMAAAGMVVLFTAEPGRRAAVFPVLALGGAAALLLSLFFWMPAMAEKDWTRLSALQEGFFSATQHHLEPGEVFGLRSAARVHTPGQPETLTFELRFLPWIGLLGVAAAFFRNRTTGRLAILGAVLAVAGVGMTLGTGRALLDAVPVLRYVQFPWRFLSLASLGFALLGAAGLHTLAPVVPRLAGRLLPVLVVAASVLASTDLLRPVAPIDVEEWMLDPAFYRESGVTMGTIEYTPVWVERAEPIRFQEGVSLTGGGRMSDLERGVARWAFTVETARAQTIVLQCFWFPDWEGTLDGEEVEIRARDGSGLVEFDCPEGIHRFEGRLVGTPLRRTTRGVSIAAASLAMFLLVNGLVAGRRRRAAG